MAPQLPITIPVPLGRGEPAEGYPWAWFIYPWLDGANPTLDGTADLAKDLAAFVAALHKIEPMDGPPSYRAETLAIRDTVTRAAIAELLGVIDTDRAIAVWESALRTPEWQGRPVWVHADISPGNVLVRDGRLSGVIDFGCAGLGEPAVDLIPAWSLLATEARNVFRAELRVDDATWQRGRGWALSIAVNELSYYQVTNPVMATIARHVLQAVLDDFGANDQPPR